MGLLNRISNMKSKGGLLALAEKFETQEIDFKTWASKKNLAECAVFSKIESFYYASDSVGFDLSSLVNSVSTADFWEGTVTDTNGCKVFKGSELTPFFQFFSDNIKNTIIKVSVIPFSFENSLYYFLAVNSDFSSSEIDSIKGELITILSSKKQADSPQEAIAAGLEVSPANLFILSAKLTLESAFSQFEKEIRDKASEAALECIFSRISRLFASPNCCSIGTNGEIKLVLFAKEEINEKLLQFHVNTGLKSFFGNDSDSNLLVLFAGCCPNVKGTSAFLIQG